eukprot:12917602-Prorocentrum_lima.AAC.1
MGEQPAAHSLTPQERTQLAAEVLQGLFVPGGKSQGRGRGKPAQGRGQEWICAECQEHNYSSRLQCRA